MRINATTRRARPWDRLWEDWKDSRTSPQALRHTNPTPMQVSLSHEVSESVKYQLDFGQARWSLFIGSLAFTLVPKATCCVTPSHVLRAGFECLACGRQAGPGVEHCTFMADDVDSAWPNVRACVEDSLAWAYDYDVLTASLEAELPMQVLRGILGSHDDWASHWDPLPSYRQAKKRALTALSGASL